MEPAGWGNVYLAEWDMPQGMLEDSQHQDSQH